MRARAQSWRVYYKTPTRVSGLLLCVCVMVPICVHPESRDSKMRAKGIRERDGIGTVCVRACVYACLDRCPIIQNFVRTSRDLRRNSRWAACQMDCLADKLVRECSEGVLNKIMFIFCYTHTLNMFVFSFKILHLLI